MNLATKIVKFMNGRAIGPELVTNGSMEAGSPPTGWVDGAPASVRATAADERTGGAGTKSLDLATAVAQTSGTALAVVALVAGKRYRFSLWYKNIDTSQVAFTIYDNAWGVLYTSPALTETSWTNLTVDFTCTATGGYIALVEVGTAGKHARFDDVSIRRLG